MSRFDPNIDQKCKKVGQTESSQKTKPEIYPTFSECHVDLTSFQIFDPRNLKKCLEFRVDFMQI